MDICMNPAIKTQYFKSIQIIFAKKHSQRKKKSLEKYGKHTTKKINNI
jgi:hypothetical protein